MICDTCARRVVALPDPKEQRLYDSEIDLRAWAEKRLMDNGSTYPTVWQIDWCHKATFLHNNGRLPGMFMKELGNLNVRATQNNGASLAEEVRHHAFANTHGRK